MSSIIKAVRNVEQPRGPRSGAAAYARAARRYDLDTDSFVGQHGIVRVKTATGEMHEVEAKSIQNDLEYVVPVTVGTPGVTLMLDFDTGSSDLWVWSSLVKADVETITGHAIYNPHNSTTSKVVPHGHWKIRYGDNSTAEGVIYSDVVKIGDLTIPKQGVEVAQKLSDSFLASGGSDGLLGLAWPSINAATPQQKTPVQNLIEGQIIQRGVFTSVLKKATEGDDGFYSFGTIPVEDGGVDESAIAYTPVDNSNGFWAIPSTFATVNGQRLELSGNTAIADTGTTLCLVSRELVDAIYNQIPGAKYDFDERGYVFPETSALPTVKLAIGDKLYTIPPNALAYASIGNGLVYGGIQWRGRRMNMDILGDTLLKHLFVVWDQENVRLGVAQRIET